MLMGVVAPASAAPFEDDPAEALEALSIPPQTRIDWALGLARSQHPEATRPINLIGAADKADDVAARVAAVYGWLALNEHRHAQGLNSALHDRQPAAPRPVVHAAALAARETGVDPGYLLRVAKAESGLNPDARAPTSTATGLFQMLDQTWLLTLKASADLIGLHLKPDTIRINALGAAVVADPVTRALLLDLRRDPRLSAQMTGALTRSNAQALRSATGRQPGPGDLYAAHVLGPSGAAVLAAAVRVAPQLKAAALFAAAARTNHGLFYDRAGRAVSVSALAQHFRAVGEGA